MGTTDDRDRSVTHGSSNDMVATIPLVEERLKVTKREVETGRVRVHVTVDESHDTLSEKLTHDEIEVEHVPRGIRVAEMPHVRLEGGTTIVPVVEEVMVVEKALMLVEEIHIRRRVVSETVEIPVTVKSERARVERVDTSGGPVAAKPE